MNATTCCRRSGKERVPARRRRCALAGGRTAIASRARSSSAGSPTVRSVWWSWKRAARRTTGRAGSMALGIEVRLLPARVRPRLRQAQQDRCRRCRALLEAARCADIVPVRIKSVEQQALQGLHRTRSLWMAHAHLAHQRAARLLPRVRHRDRRRALASASSRSAACSPIRTRRVPELIRPTMTLLVEEIRLLEVRIAQLETRARPQLARQSPACTDAAVGPRRRLAHRDRHGRGHRRPGQPLQGCPTLRLLVRPDAQGTLLRHHPPPRAHLQAR